MSKTKRSLSKKKGARHSKKVKARQIDESLRKRSGKNLTGQEAKILNVKFTLSRPKKFGSKERPDASKS